MYLGSSIKWFLDDFHQINDMGSITFFDMANFVKITYVLPVWQQNERKPI